MRVSKIKVEGFRSFVDEVIMDNLNKVNIFIGKNNTGKTNILEIFRLLQKLTQNELYRHQKDFFSKDNKSISLNLEFVLEKTERDKLIGDIFQLSKIQLKDLITSNFLRKITHQVKISFEGGVEDETISISNVKAGDVIVWRMSAEQTANRMVARGSNLYLKCTHIEQIENLELPLVDRCGFSLPHWGILSNYDKKNDILPKIISEFYSNIEWTSPIRQAQTTMPVEEKQKLNDNGSNLAQVWNTIASGEPEKLAKILNEMKNLMPHIAAIKAPVEGTQTRAFIKEPSKYEFDLSNTSSGLHQAAILITKILTCPKGGALLIEEPELHFHASAQRTLKRPIEEYSDDIQFFITTHSTIFATISSKVSVYLVTRNGVKSNVKQIKEPDEFRFIKWELGHSNTDLYGFNLVIFIEGDSEHIALPIIVESLGYDLAQSGIKLINVQGSGKAKKIGQYLEYLKDSDTTPFIIMDGNKEVKQKIEDWERSNLLPNGNYQMWDLEFEDIFSPELITECCAELGYGGVTIAKLKQSNNSSSVVPIIKKILHEQEKELDKPALTETIAKKIARDKEHLPTELKETIKKIFQLAESRLRASNIN